MRDKEHVELRVIHRDMTAGTAIPRNYHPPVMNSTAVLTTAGSFSIRR